MAKGKLKAAAMRHLPESLFLPGLYIGKPQQILITRFPLDLATTTALSTAAHNKQPLDIILAATTALQRQILIPKAAKAHAEGAISVQVRQTMPANAKGLVWRSALSKVLGDQIEYSVFFIKSEQLEDLRKLVSNAGGDLRSIRFADAASAPLLQGNAGQGRAVRMWTMLALGFSVVLPLLSILDLEWRVYSLGAANSKTAARVADLEAEAVAAQQRAIESGSKFAALQADVDALNQQSRRLSILSDLTSSLPDTVWVSEFSIHDGTLLLSGFSAGEVTKVIEILQGLPWVASVKLEGAIAYDSYTQQNRFDLRVDVAQAHVFE